MRLFLPSDFPAINTGSPLLSSLLTTSILIGAWIGALVAGSVADRFGRRRVLLAVHALYALLATALALQPTLEGVMIVRGLLGLAVGGGTVLVPTYVAEVSPAAWRGLFGTMIQMNVSTGL